MIWRKYSFYIQEKNEKVRTIKQYVYHIDIKKIEGDIQNLENLQRIKFRITNCIWGCKQTYTYTENNKVQTT